MALLLPLTGDVEQTALRWEWRAFAPEFAPLEIRMPNAFEAIDQTYVLCRESNARARIRDSSLTVDVLEHRHDRLELWRRSLAVTFPLCQRDVRDVLRQFPVRLPTLYRPEYSPFEFVADVATCTGGLRVIGVRSLRRRTARDDCIIERATLTFAGDVVQTIAVFGTDPCAVERMIRLLQLHHFANQNIVVALKAALGMTADVAERIPVVSEVTP